MWLASGEGAGAADFKSTLQYSFDGSNFFAANSATGFVDPGTSYLNVTFRPTWNGRMWLAGRASAGLATNNACYSYDGSNWLTLSIPTIPGSVLNFTWNGNYWLAFGLGSATAGQSVAISRNGFNWVRAATHPAVTANCYTRGAAWNGRNWISLSDGATAGQFAISHNNSIWNSITTTGTAYRQFGVLTPWNYYNPTGANCNWQQTQGNIYWDGKKYYAIGATNAGTSNKIITSSNGVNWTGTRQTFLFDCAFYSYGFARGAAIAWQSNVEADISLPTLDINTGRYFKQYQSTNQIYSMSSLITFNNTLFVDSTQQTSINSFNSTFSTAYTFYVDGSMLTYGAAKLGGATTWTAISDERVKTDITYADVSKCYYTIRDTHVHAYNFKPEYVDAYNLKPTLQYGLYAQELETVLPKSVIETDVLGTKVKMVDPSQLNMMHYGASVYMYSTLNQNFSTFIGRNTEINNYPNNTSYSNFQRHLEQTPSLQNARTYLANLATVFSSNYAAP
jgi:hypothetical protein